MNNLLAIIIVSGTTPEGSNVYRNGHLYTISDPGRGRTFLNHVLFYNHIIPLGL